MTSHHCVSVSHVTVFTVVDHASDAPDFSRLAGLLVAYRSAADRAAAAGAHLAALAMSGSALEAALLALAVLEEEKVRSRGLWPRKRAKKGAEFLNLIELVEIATAMDWIEATPGLDLLASHRTLLHPGRVIRDGLPTEVSESDYAAASQAVDKTCQALTRATRTLANGTGDDAVETIGIEPATSALQGRTTEDS